MTYKEIALRLYEACFGASIMSQDEQTRIEELLFDKEPDTELRECDYCGWVGDSDDVYEIDGELVCKWCES